MKKPELLLPVGNVEAFYAALKGGADAVYLGLKNFNARERATNFSNYQLLQLLDEAASANVKVYVTLNTVIKNSEIGELIDTLWFLSQTKVSAVIIQDWGTYFLLKNFFPKLPVHASTQMANHNSAGATFSKKMGFSRVILSRELTLPELESIQEKSPIETEVFVHGALCYSFSGMCLFSSYLGGAGANRGLCAQPCRRFYDINEEKKLVFSLKDNQQITLIPKLMELGVHSLKIEGRLKSAEYVYQVARAYRMVIDNPKTLPEAVELLSMDMGREKTQWFYSNQVAKSISLVPGTGLPIGKITRIADNKISIESTAELKPGYRLRVRTQNDSEPVTFTLDHIHKTDEKTFQISAKISGIKTNDELTLVGTGQFRFPSKLKGEPSGIIKKIAPQQKAAILTRLKHKRNSGSELLYVRINNLDWLPMLSFAYFNQLVLQLSKTDWNQINLEVPIFQENKSNIWFELPQFIPEKDIEFYRNRCSELANQGFNRFSLSHLSQKELLPTTAVFGTNENVYCYNDAAACVLESVGAQWATSPFENEMENLISGTNRNQILPLYFYPKLFYSRQPINMEDEKISSEKQNYRRQIVNGITHLLPEIPVSLLQYKAKLTQQGFYRYLIDLSFETPSKTTLKKVFTRLKQSEAVQPSTTFNFKKGLR
ncbi:MAG: peptidase U32 family protein [Salinivirgaceae bacterium]|jgi:putative protease